MLNRILGCIWFVFAIVYMIADQGTAAINSALIMGMILFLAEELFERLDAIKAAIDSKS